MKYNSNKNKETTKANVDFLSNLMGSVTGSDRASAKYEVGANMGSAIRVPDEVLRSRMQQCAHWRSNVIKNFQESCETTMMSPQW